MDTLPPSNHLPHIGNIFSRVGCVATCLCNGLLIFLTVSGTRRINGAFKYLIIIFSTVCIFFLCLEILAHPYLQNYNGGFIYFSLNTPSSYFPEEFSKFLIILYAGTYASIMCLVAIQFVYRYAALMNLKPLLSSFKGWKSVIWIFYVLFFSFVFGLLCQVCAFPEPYSDSYMRDEIRKLYNLEVSRVPRSIVVAYNPDDSIRWFNLGFLFGAMFILAFQYVLIAYCGIQMQRQMTRELKNFSIPHRKLQQQFFKALVVQITIPTILYHLPALPVLFSPLFNLKLSIQSGFIFSIFSIYPPVDTLAFMWIVSEYKDAVKKIIYRKSKVSTKLVSEILTT